MGIHTTYCVRAESCGGCVINCSLLETVLCHLFLMLGTWQPSVEHLLFFLITSAELFWYAACFWFLGYISAFLYLILVLCMPCFESLVNAFSLLVDFYPPFYGMLPLSVLYFEVNYISVHFCCSPLNHTISPWSSSLIPVVHSLQVVIQVILTASVLLLSFFFFFCFLLWYLSFSFCSFFFFSCFLRCCEGVGSAQGQTARAVVFGHQGLRVTGRGDG